VADPRQAHKSARVPKVFVDERVAAGDHAACAGMSNAAVVGSTSHVSVWETRA
jgi:hypothetical protein